MDAFEVDVESNRKSAMDALMKLLVVLRKRRLKISKHSLDPKVVNKPGGAV